MSKYNVLKESNSILNELPAAERLAVAKRGEKENSNADVNLLVGTPAYWYIVR